MRATPVQVRPSCHTITSREYWAHPFRDSGLAGEPGIQLDTELSLQMWRHGYKVGLWYSGVSNGVGGRKTRTNRHQKRARVRNDAVNSERCTRLMEDHDASLVTTANSALARLRDSSETRRRHLASLGWLEPRDCHASLPS